MMSVKGAVTTALGYTLCTVAAAACLTHMTSSLLLGAAIGCAACCYHPSCRTSTLRGTEALCGLAIAVWASYLYWTGESPHSTPSLALYRGVCVYMGMDAAWMLFSFNGVRLGWDGLSRHLVTYACLLMMTGGAVYTPSSIVQCGFLYLSTEALLVFEQDYCRNPSRQTAVPWLLFVGAYRLPVWHFCAYTVYTCGWPHLVPVLLAFIVLDCSAARDMAQWLLDPKKVAESASKPSNMWCAFYELLQVAALYSRKVARGADTRARLNAMYSLSADEYDASRKLTLFGRQALIDVVALQAEKQLADRSNGSSNHSPRPGALGVWLDIGGGTASNILAVSQRIDLSLFAHIFVVDYSDEMCAHARSRVLQYGWSNVSVVRADAAEYVPPACYGRVGLVTMSYSLSMIPGYAKLVDTVAGYCDQATRIVVADFFTSKPKDSPLRQHSWWRRALMQAWFAIDDVDLSPVRREVCEQSWQLAWESNHMGPLLNKSIAKLSPQVPYYLALYMLPAEGDPLQRCGLTTATRYVSPKHNTCDWVCVPSFLYSYAIEDPLVDAKFLDFKSDDSLLMLTTGGDNVLHWLPKVAHVTAVDMNEKQNYLLELKFAAIAYSGLPLDTVQQWLEAGSHSDIDTLLGRVAPYLSAEARQFWATHKYMMEADLPGAGGGHNGLYLYGSYGLVLAVTRLMCSWLGMTDKLDSGDSSQARSDIAESWKYNWLKKAIITPLCHPTLMWPSMGIPMQQHARIEHGQTMHEFINNTIDGTFVHTSWESNPYSRAFACGRFTGTCHPDYLDADNLQAIRAIPEAELPARLTIATAPYEDAMQRRMYSKMVFSDHLDWLSDAAVREFAVKVKSSLLPGGLASFRSAALVASYAQAFIDAGLECERVATHQGLGMDRLNSYASFYVIRQTAVRAPISSPNLR